MSRLGRVSLVAFVLLTSVSLASAADVLERRGGAAKLSGKVTAVSKDKVSFETSKGEKSDIPTNEVEEIIWDGEPAALKSARNNEAAGKLTSAADGLAKAATDNKSDRPEIKLDIEYFTNRVAARQALTDPAKIPDALKRLTDFQTKNGDNRHFYDVVGLLVDLNLTAKDAAAARSAAETLAKAAGNDQKMAAKIALGRVSLLENKIPDAEKAFDEVASSAATGPAEESRKLQAKLGKAYCLQLQSKFDDAIKLLDEVIAQASPEDSRVQSEAYVRQGDCYQAAGKSKDALIAYLHVDVLFSTEKAFHPEALYHLSRLWTAIQQPDRANEAADKLAAEYPNSPWTQKLKSPGAAAASGG
jgi:tetratricopeptide (TPR) repeat protein